MTLGRAVALDGDEGKLAEAVEQQRMAVRLQPGTVALHHNLAAVLAIAGRVHERWRCWMRRCNSIPATQGRAHSAAWPC